MNMPKIALMGAGVGLVALVCVGAWWWRQNKSKQGPAPSKPPRAPVDPDADPDEVPPDQRPSRADVTKPAGHTVDDDNLDPELTKVLNSLYGKGDWLPDEQTLNDLELDDVIVFAVESEEIGNYTETRQELISAKVLSVEKSEIRARIFGEVKYAEHHGSHAGHGYRIGDLVEIPRSKVLVAARRNDMDKTGYGSQGDPAETFEPTSMTKRVYTIKPNTPYDLILPYRTKELAWYVDRDLVKLKQVGEKNLIEQIMFSEDSLRGEVNVRAIDGDPELGAVFVARWQFKIES